MTEKAEDVADGADALLILTEWTEFKSLPYAAMKKRMLSPLLFDGRNLLDAKEMRGLGFTYTGIGH
jgi:UDPglucose 6-dehydrogenase